MSRAIPLRPPSCVLFARRETTLPFCTSTTLRLDTVAICPHPVTLWADAMWVVLVQRWVRATAEIPLPVLKRITAVQMVQRALTLLSHCIHCLPINRQHTPVSKLYCSSPQTQNPAVLEKLLVAFLLKFLELYGTLRYCYVHPAYNFNIILPSVCLPFRFPE